MRKRRRSFSNKRAGKLWSDTFFVGALRKHAGGMFLASDRSGYAARREVSKDAHGSDTFFVSPKKVSKEIDQGGPQSPQVGVPLWNPLPKLASPERPCSGCWTDESASLVGTAAVTKKGGVISGVSRPEDKPSVGALSKQPGGLFVAADPKRLCREGGTCGRASSLKFTPVFPQAKKVSLPQSFLIWSADVRRCKRAQGSPHRGAVSRKAD